MMNRAAHLPGHQVVLALLLIRLPGLDCSRLLAQNQSPEDYFLQASEAEKRQDFAGAEKIYLEAARNYPNQPEIFKRLGIIYQTELKFQESIDTFQKVLDGAPQYPELHS